MTENGLYCPECGHNMSKSGGASSGRHLYQQYRCPKCLRSTIRPLDSQGNKVDKKPYTKKITGEVR